MIIGLEERVHKRNRQRAVASFPGLQSQLTLAVIEGLGTRLSGQCAWLAQSFPPAALGKAYEHHVGKALHSAAYL